jgi:hypothetical protein
VPGARRVPIFGGHGEGDPPVPIPNTEVKPFSADGTASIRRGRVGRRRDLSRGPTAFAVGPLFVFPTQPVVFGRMWRELAECAGATRDGPFSTAVRDPRGGRPTPGPATRGPPVRGARRVRGHAAPWPPDRSAASFCESESSVESAALRGCVTGGCGENRTRRPMAARWPGPGRSVRCPTRRCMPPGNQMRGGEPNAASPFCRLARGSDGCAPVPVGGNG